MQITVNDVKITLTQDQIDQIIKENTKSKQIEWKDFGKIEGYYIGSQSKSYNYEFPSSNSANRNIFPTKEEAEACLALSQLCQWRDKYNGNWQPDYTSMDTKYQIYFYRGQISKDNHLSTSFVLTFKTSEIRDKFLEDFSELINQAKSLL